MDNDFLAATTGFILGMLTASMLIIIIGGARSPKVWQDEAIKHNCGYYHSETGEFIWHDYK